MVNAQGLFLPGFLRNTVIQTAAGQTGTNRGVTAMLGLMDTQQDCRNMLAVLEAGIISRTGTFGIHITVAVDIDLDVIANFTVDGGRESSGFGIIILKSDPSPLVIGFTLLKGFRPA
ncbi:hypothetical protein D3C81_1065730 [compost metagenome]